MINKSKFGIWAIITIIALIGFCITACAEEEDDTIPLPTPIGWLTINDIDEHNGKYAFVGGSDPVILGMQSFRGNLENPETWRFGLVPISGGTVSIPLYIGLSIPVEAYGGNHDVDHVYVTIFNTQTVLFASINDNDSRIVDEQFVARTKTFSNGNLTLSWTTPADWMD